jgi:ABC-2 type transport system permease protein
MKNVLTIARRELKSSFNSPVAYAVILGYLLFTGIYLYFLQGFYVVGQADLRPYFTIMPIVLCLLVPALTMRSWAEERRLGTYELLLTLPFKEGELVLGKFLSSFALAGLAVALTIPVPLTASMLGSFDVGVLVTQYLGVLLMAAAAVALGEWISSLAKNQVSAFVGSVLALLVLVKILGSLAGFFQTGGILASFFNWLSLAFHYDSFSRGVIDTRDLAYYLSATVLFLYLSAWGLTRRKWS